MSNRDINIMGKSIKEAQEVLKAQENIAYGNEPSTHELIMYADGEWRVVSDEERKERLVDMPKGTKVWNGKDYLQAEGAELSKTPVYEPINEETKNYIQSWYERRRD